MQIDISDKEIAGGGAFDSGKPKDLPKEPPKEVVEEKKGNIIIKYLDIKANNNLFGGPKK
jgi:hypothetical protein